MKNLLFLSILLFACEESKDFSPEAEPPQCMDCVTTVTYSDGSKEIYPIFCCSALEIQKRLDLNRTVIECGKPVRYQTICTIPETKKRNDENIQKSIYQVGE